MEQQEIIKNLIERGKEAGYLTYQEIARQLPEASVTPEELDSLFWTLEEKGIQILDTEEESGGKIKTEEPAAEPNVPVDIELDTQNSIRMYLSEMGRVPLLNREEEVTLSRNI